MMAATDMTRLSAWLAGPGAVCVPHAALAAYTTFQLGGPCPLLVDCTTTAAAIRAVRCLADHHVPRLFIGGGSNLLVADAGIDTVVVRYVVRTPDIRLDGDALTVSGGTAFDDVAVFCCRHGVAGFVNASGIPGTLGGAVVGNAGAFGWQVGDALVALELLTPDGAVATVPADAHTFTYRNSTLKGSDTIVLAATFAVEAADSAALWAARERILQLRQEKHPDWRQTPCAGSFFRNIEPSSAAARRQAAGWFLEQAGAKDMQVGGAAVFERHANILVKRRPECTARDVLELAARMSAVVAERFNVRLVREVQVIGDVSRGTAVGASAAGFFGFARK